jgi:hypothetical protein
MRILRIAGAVAAALPLLAGSYYLYTVQIVNPRVARELVDNPDGERAHRVMMLTLPSGRSIPVNYLREDETVYAAADGSWWKELVGDGAHDVTVLVRGETLAGRAQAVLDDPAHTRQVFLRLRPNALEGFGTLIEIHLDPSQSTTPTP